MGTPGGGIQASAGLVLGCFGASCLRAGDGLALVGAVRLLAGDGLALVGADLVGADLVGRALRGGSRLDRAADFER